MSKTVAVRKMLGTASRYCPHFIFVCCVLTTGFAAASSHAIFSTHWPSTLWDQTLILFIVVGLIGTAVALSSALFTLRFELRFALLAIVGIALFCGLAATAVVLYFLVSSACLATLLLFAFPDADEVPLNVQVVIGWASYGIIFTALASAKIHTAPVHATILAIPVLIVVAAPELRRAAWRCFSRLFSPSAESVPQPLYAAGFIVCIVVLSFHLAEAALPERYFDALVMHLYIPSYMAGHQAWSFDVHDYAFAHMAMAVDFLYANVFLLQGEQAARLLNLVALLFICVAIFQIAVRCTSKTATIWAIALFVSIPVALIESTSLFIEHSVALFIIYAVLAIILADFRVSLLSHTTVVIVLAAATASKLHGAIGAVVVGIASSALYLLSKRERSEYIKFSTITFAAAGLALWPYIRAWYDTGNPIFPFFNAIFKSPYYPVENFVDSRWIGNLSPWMLFQMTFHSSRFLECADGALGFSLFVFLAAGIAAAIYRRNKIVLFSVGMSGLILLAVCLPNQYLRYIYIFVPLLMIGVAFAIDELGRPQRWRIPVAAAVVIVVVLNVFKFPAGGWVIGASDLRGVFDSDARRQLVLAQIPERLANQAINDIAGPSARVLYFANPFAALLTGTAIYDEWYNIAYSRDLARITSEEALNRLVQKIAPTYIIFDPSRAQQSNRGPRYAIIRSYLGHAATLVTKIGRISIYQISFTDKRG